MNGSIRAAAEFDNRLFCFGWGIAVGVNLCCLAYLIWNG